MFGAGLAAPNTPHSDLLKKKCAGRFQVRVTRVEANFKLSQNRDDEDHANIIRQLEARGDEQSVAIANEMRKNSRV